MFLHMLKWSCYCLHISLDDCFCAFAGYNFITLYEILNTDVPLNANYKYGKDQNEIIICFLGEMSVFLFV